ncbi:MAG: hypothetical protein RSF70_10350, partial [Ruthenibacterium sp.]
TDLNRANRILKKSGKVGESKLEGFRMGENLQSIAAENRLALWTERVSACRDRGNGKSVQMWCAENGVNRKAYYYWQHKILGIAKDSRTPQFVEMPTAEYVYDVGNSIAQPHKTYAETAKSRADAAIAKIAFEKAMVEIYSGADEATLRALFRGLQQC